MSEEQVVPGGGHEQRYPSAGEEFQGGAEGDAYMEVDVELDKDEEKKFEEIFKKVYEVQVSGEDAVDSVQVQVGHRDVVESRMAVEEPNSSDDDEEEEEEDDAEVAEGGQMKSLQAPSLEQTACPIKEAVQIKKAQRMKIKNVQKPLKVMKTSAAVLKNRQGCVKKNKGVKRKLRQGNRGVQER